jgi:biopolymer transport protein ExbD
MSFSTFSQREKRFNAKLPLVTSSHTPAQMPLDIVLHVKNQNNIVVNDATTYDILGLCDAMMQLTAVGQDTTIIIEADPNSSYQDVVSVLDACAHAHLTKVALRPLPDKLASAQ